VIADAPATVVWIAPEPPAPSEAQSLARWALAVGVRLAEPTDARPPPLTPHHDAAAAVEDLLDKARDAIASRDADAIDRATASAEALLRANPALPQASWLMAEVERARATRWRRVAPEDAEAGERAWMRAQALDGGRVAGIGEVGSAATPASATVALAFPVEDEARLDGIPVGAGDGIPVGAGGSAVRSVTTVAGPHDLVVTIEGATVWAGWIDVPPGASRIDVDAPGAVPCSRADVARASTGAASVACGSWVAVSRGTQPGAIRIARCGAGRCDAAVEWSESAAWARATPPGSPSPTDTPGAHARAPWPAWATWALAGAGVVLATGIAIAASGALESAPTTTRFVTGGLKPQ
jgi:hypothetical protein